MSRSARMPAAWIGEARPDVPSDALSGLLSGIADIALVIRGDGTILGLRAEEELSGRLDLAGWIGDRLHDHLTRESLPKLDRCLTQLAEGGPVVPLTQLNHPVTGDSRDIPMSYGLHRMEDDDQFLALGRDLRPMAEMQQRIVAAQIALEREYETQRDTDTRLRVLMNATSEACIFVSVGRGEIVEANPAAGGLFERVVDGLSGAAVEELLRSANGGDLIDQLVEAAADQSGGKVAARALGSEVELDVLPISFRMSGAHTLLCRLVPRDAASLPGGAMEQRLTELYARTPDALIFVSRGGQILSANDAFLDLADVAQEQGVRGRSLADFLNRGGIDMTVLLDNAARSGTLRLFATKIVTSHGQTSPIEMSVTRLGAGAEPVFGFVIRDTSRVDAMRGTQQSSDVVDIGSVMGLLGKQSLKDIVANTTDMIERMCIEAAVQLTSNNRLAAADMLGLSRQSLYVKLRKYDLLKRDAG